MLLLYDKIKICFNFLEKFINVSFKKYFWLSNNHTLVFIVKYVNTVRVRLVVSCTVVPNYLLRYYNL